MGFHEYVHRDHLGSIEKVTRGEDGSVIDLNTAFDPDGRRRSPDWSGQLQQTELEQLLETQGLTTRRGFTGHEHLDRTGLIHMNGRIYDPRLGRFLSPDPLVQVPSYSQSWNRYAYAFNNPLAYSDPTGYSADDAKGDQIKCVGDSCSGSPGVTILTGFAARDFLRDVQVDQYAERSSRIGQPKSGGEAALVCFEMGRCKPNTSGSSGGDSPGSDSDEDSVPPPQSTVPERIPGSFAQEGRLAQARALTDPFVRGYDTNDPNFHQYEIGPSFGCLEGNGCSEGSVASIVDSEAVPFKLVPPGNGNTTLLGTNPINHYSVGNFSVNDTISGYWFHPGTVVHVTFQSGGAIWFYTRGVGTGPDQFWNKAIGYGAFGKMHSDVRSRINMEILGQPLY